MAAHSPPTRRTERPTAGASGGDPLGEAPRSTRPLRADQADAVRTRLLHAALAVIEAGQEPTMRAVAAQAGVGERTIYRYFPTREDFLQALGDALPGRAGIPLCRDAAGLAAYARDLYQTFAANEALVRALVVAPWAAAEFRRTRRQHIQALSALLEAAWPTAPDADRTAAAAALRTVLSGAGWTHLRDCGFSNEEAVQHALWLVRTLEDRLADMCTKHASLEGDPHEAR